MSKDVVQFVICGFEVIDRGLHASKNAFFAPCGLVLVVSGLALCFFPCPLDIAIHVCIARLQILSFRWMRNSSFSFVHVHGLRRDRQLKIL